MTCRPEPDFIYVHVVRLAHGEGDGAREGSGRNRERFIELMHVPRDFRLGDAVLHTLCSVLKLRGNLLRVAASVASVIASPVPKLRQKRKNCRPGKWGGGANRAFPALSVAGGSRSGRGRFAGGRDARNDLGWGSQRQAQPRRQFSSFPGAAVAQRPSEDSCGSGRVTLQWRF